MDDGGYILKLTLLARVYTPHHQRRHFSRSLALYNDQKMKKDRDLLRVNFPPHKPYIVATET
jgi:hypothetical protein